MTGHSARSGSSENDDYHLPDYIHILLLSALKNSAARVLMIHNSSSQKWDLPYLTYPDSLRHDGERCTADLERMLAISPLPDRRAFTVVAELLGAYAGSGLHKQNPVGFSRLVLVEAHVALQAESLPNHTEWKDAGFLNQILCSLDKSEGNYGALQVALEYLLHGHEKMEQHCDPRYHLGWFDEATSWLKAELQRQGRVAKARVVQKHVSSTSTLLSIESDSETFFLKAPALGCAEISITATLSSLFPRNVVDVIATSEKLNSFIMRGFNHREPEEEQYEELLMVLGSIQLASLEHMDSLKAAGCEERGPGRIAEKIGEWARDEDIRGIFGYEIESLEQGVGKVRAVCARLSEYKIPLTVVHGDFDTRNASVLREDVCKEGRGTSFGESAVSVPEKNRGFLLFDWQYGCISHPFLDFHEWEGSALEGNLDGYLDLWTEFESIDRIREAFELGRHLGWCLKMWTSIECFRACNVQKKSSTAEFVYDAFMRLRSEISQIESLVDPGEVAGAKEIV